MKLHFVLHLWVIVHLRFTKCLVALGYYFIYMCVLYFIQQYSCHCLPFGRKCSFKLPLSGILA